ncbi:MAG: pentapeptide repeat-containing protein [Proteobacteria bacterium]|nr:pentapeptide repeat-containing protein [Pseudomonadota bacterium]
MTLVNSNREHLVDQRFETDVSTVEYSNKLFLRVVAKGRKFENIDFKYTIFDTAYLRDCIFDSCDFTGCRFVGAIRNKKVIAT